MSDQAAKDGEVSISAGAAGDFSMEIGPDSVESKHVSHPLGLEFVH